MKIFLISAFCLFGFYFPHLYSQHLSVEGKASIGTSDTTHQLTIGSEDTTVLRLLGPLGVYNHGAQINFGDEDYALIEEDDDDKLTIFADARTAIMGGNVGIGTKDPKQRLHVNGDYYGKGHLWLYAFQGDGNSGTAYIQGRDDSGVSNIGLQFRTQQSGNIRDVLAISANGNAGINRSVFSNTGLGIRSNNANLYALYVEDSSENFKVGIFQSGNLVIGEAPPNVGLNVKTASNIIINAGVKGGATVFQVLPNGDAVFTGNLSKGGGSFKIDHPLDPENKYLYHSFVESPDMMNVYNGNVNTDANGLAKVKLPDYFEKLNTDFRYQLTVIGTFAQAIIKEKVNNNHFVIQTSEPNIEVSWQVTGIRQDPFAEVNRIQVEVEKEPENKGRYLHPLPYGKAASQTVLSTNIKKAEDH